ncbi:phosphate signaling complex protein PhoU [Terriglobus roseus]|uniref:Phosphate-specific transport system accessory protein PhoU n=1 Tax=Terriglobus roseus TaxID=392734 RepID=A0A1H4KDW2_9BACT|nr:phosphate signaling complex protein PhoU [Terriglobus roseus]SEB56305.1 phosphate uptake regulator, PhoU [Terriglobus roseus]
MTRINFQHKLDELRERLLVMAGLVEQAIDRAIEAYDNRDAGLCDLVLMAEPAIDRTEREIDQLALDILAMEQPTAVDLRFILAVIRINADLERVGDQAVNITGRVKELLTIPEAELPIDIPKIAEIASTMVRMAIKAFIDHDEAASNEVLLMDDEVDKLNHDAFHTLGELIKVKPDVTQQALNALVISRNLERVGDHATNIAEDVIFWVSGADVRHHASSMTSLPEQISEA